MHAYATNSHRLRVATALAVVAVPITLGINAIAPGSWLYSLSYPAVLAGLLSWFDRYGWRLQSVRTLHDPTPVVAGTYEGRLKSQWREHTADPWNDVDIPIRIEIDQRWTDLRLDFTVLGERTSTAYSTSARLHNVGNGRAELLYTFHNDPERPAADPDMKPHAGTAVLTILDDGSVNGTYYNARLREGTLTLHRVDA